MLSILEILKFSEFNDFKVVAGKEHLDQIIRWAHPIDVPDAAEWLRGGELVLTTAIALPEDKVGREKMIEALFERNTAGLLISVGGFIDSTPLEMVKIADLLGFPIIEAPWRIPLIDIAEPINSNIISHQYTLLQETSIIYQSLSKLVLSGGGIPDLASELATLLDRSITIESPSFELLAFAENGSIDNVRKQSVDEKKTPISLIDALEHRGDLLRIKMAQKPLEIKPIPELGMTMSRVVAPIMVGGELYGYMWLVGNDRPLSDLDHMAIETAATIAGFILLREQTIMDTENRLKGDFITLLVQNGFNNRASLLQQAAQFNLDLRNPHAILVIGSNIPLVDKKATIVIQITKIASEANTFISVFDNNIIAVVEDDQGTITGLVKKFRGISDNLWVGLGETVNVPEELGKSYEQAHEAMLIAKRLRIDKGYMQFDKLGYLHILFHSKPEHLENNCYLSKIRNMKELQKEDKGADLYITLETYLNNAGNAQKTARDLYVHRSTLLYRLARIEELFGLSLDDHEIRVNLHIALVTEKLTTEI